MIIVATLVVSLAAALHVGIFIMQSVAWSRPTVWKRFGIKSQADAEVNKPLAYNQGFYNLFLAIGAVVGIIFFAVGSESVGVALVVFAMASMVAASVVLLSSGRHFIIGALVQGVLPLIGMVLILMA